MLPTAIVVLLVASACAAQQAVAPTASPSPDVTDSPEPTPSDTAEAESTPSATDKETGEPETGAVPGVVIEAMKADAADRAGIDPDSVDVVSAEPVTWDDGSLGCPEPGQGYIQALTPGYHVILQAGGQEYDYRAADNGAFKLCENPDGSDGGGIVDY